MNRKSALLLALLAALVLGSVSGAAAAELKASGEWIIESSWRGNYDFNKQSQDNRFQIAQRMRTQFEFQANENLKAVLGTQIGEANWGNGLFEVGAGRSNTASATLPGNAANGGAGNIMLYKGYLDFKWPGTKVNALVGFQTVNLPAAFGGGSVILDEQAAAAIVAAPITENITLLVGFSRLIDLKAANAATQAAGSTPGNLDAVFAALPLDFKGVSLTPFAMYATGGSGLNASALAGLSNNATGDLATGSNGLKAYWGGAAFTMTALEPFKLMADFNYGSAKYDNAPGLNPSQKGGRSGYLFDIALDYTGLTMMTPELFYVYTSGEGGGSNATNGKSERMPLISAQTWAAGSTFFMQGDSMLGGSISTPNDSLGFWALGLSLKDIKVVDKLSSTFNLIYFKGTNNADTVRNYDALGAGKAYGMYLTTKDSLWEFGLNNKYAIFDELTLNLDLGYLKADFDKDLWSTVTGGSPGDLSKDAYKLNLGLVYTF